MVWYSTAKKAVFFKIGTEDGRSPSVKKLQPFGYVPLTRNEKRTILRKLDLWDKKTNTVILETKGKHSLLFLFPLALLMGYSEVGWINRVFIRDCSLLRKSWSRTRCRKLSRLPLDKFAKIKFGGHLQSLSEDCIYNSLIQQQKETNFAERGMSLFMFLKGNPPPPNEWECDEPWLVRVSVTSPHVYE